MGALTPYLRKAEGGYLHWCPGCAHAHFIAVGRDRGPNWTFDGNIEKPTFAPSIRIFTPAHVDEDDGPQPERTECHYFIRRGMIEFCTDSAHAFAGKTVALPEMASEADYGYPP